MNDTDICIEKYWNQSFFARVFIGQSIDIRIVDAHFLSRSDQRPRRGEMQWKRG